MSDELTFEKVNQISGYMMMFVLIGASITAGVLASRVFGGTLAQIAGGAAIAVVVFFGAILLIILAKTAAGEDAFTPDHNLREDATEAYKRDEITHEQFEQIIDVLERGDGQE